MDLGETVGKFLIFCNVPQQRGRSAASSICLHKLTLTQNRIGGVESARTHKGRNMQVEGSSDSLSIHSQRPPIRTSQVPPKTPLFIIIHRTHMHRHIILLQCVDLNNTYRSPLTTDASSPKTAATLRITPGYARGFTVRK